MANIPDYDPHEAIRREMDRKVLEESEGFWITVKGWAALIAWPACIALLIVGIVRSL